MVKKKPRRSERAKIQEETKLGERARGAEKPIRLERAMVEEKPNIIERAKASEAVFNKPMIRIRTSSKVIDSKIPEIVHLYINEKLSTYGIAERIGIAPSTVRRKLRKLGILRNRSEAQKIKRLRQPGFLCRLCGKRKPIDELVKNKRYFPPIPCCKQCAGY